MPDTSFLEQFDRDSALAEVAERADRVSRRALLGGSFTGVTLGILGRPAAAAARRHHRLDVAILNYALGLEYLQASFYTEAERIGALRGALAQQAQIVGSHERAHVTAFQQVLGSAALKRPSFDFRGVTAHPDTFRRTAVAFEDLAAAAYKDQAPRIHSRVYLQAAIEIHSVEARHAAWIRRLAGYLPAANAFDLPLSPHRVRELVISTRFVVGSPRTEVVGLLPRFTG